MSDHPVVALLANDWHRLQLTNPHTGEIGQICMPGYQNLPEGHENGEIAILYSKAVIETIRLRYKYEILSKDQIAAKVAAASGPPAPPEKTTLRCKRCNGAVLNVRVDDNRVDVGLLSAALGAHAEVCR